MAGRSGCFLGGVTAPRPCAALLAHGRGSLRPLSDPAPILRSMNDAPGAKVNQRMYELRAEGLTMPEIIARLEAEGYRVPGNALPEHPRESPTGDPSAS